MVTLTPLVLAVRAVYISRGFNILYISEDNDFVPLRENPTFILTGMNLNITSADDDKSSIDQFNRSLKERFRMIFATLTFLLNPKRMTVELVYSQLFWLIF